MAEQKNEGGNIELESLMKQEISAAAEVATEQSAMVGESQDANLDV